MRSCSVSGSSVVVGSEELPSRVRSVHVHVHGDGLGARLPGNDMKWLWESLAPPRADSVVEESGGVLVTHGGDLKDPPRSVRLARDLCRADMI